ncbi:MAG: ABC transporter permease [Micromonosporaceae bacterium]|nr:ABC transporter permease [Micromonosporaceae bacterium]
MTTLTVYEAAAGVAPTAGYWNRARKTGAVLIGLGLLAAVLCGLAAKAGADARFTLAAATTGRSVPVPARPGAIAFGLLCALAGAVLLTRFGARLVGTLTAIGLVAVIASALCWQVAGQIMPLGDVGSSTIQSATPLVFGAMAGVLCERSGVINVAIEGQLLSGAFLGALFGTIAASIWIGLLAAMLGGVVIAALLAVLAIRYLVDQVVLGVVLNLFVLGMTGFLFTQVMQKNSDRYNFPPILPAWQVPGLSKIPLLGPALLRQNALVYLAIVLVVAVHFALFRTRWGLRTRAVGEHPTAADTVGIRVRGTRYRNVLLAGVFAGLGGAYLTLGGVGGFTNNMTNGRGYIALAALIFGRWSPVGATLAALLFGFFGALATFLGLTSSIPNEFLAMLPYIVTIVAVAGLVGRVRAPAADGKPYVKS